MEVSRLKVGQLDSNCYLLIDEESDVGVIVDPGDDGDFIIQKVLDERVKIEAIIATHGHYDHVLAVNEMKMAFEAPFLMRSEDEFLLERMRETTKHFSDFDPGTPPKVDEYLNEVERFGFGNVKLEVLHTPGHTPGSVSLYSKENSKLFVGDVLFAGGGVGRTDFSYCSSTDLWKSIKKLLSFPNETKVFSGHGDEFYLMDEKKYYKDI